MYVFFSDNFKVPLKKWPDGVIRVGKTRVTLDTIIEAFFEGATAEEIALQYPSIQIADVYSVIAYYLNHKKTVDRYIENRQFSADKVRNENEKRFLLAFGQGCCADNPRKCAE
jgi:uncharacterized protein (DUF433 family)